MLFASGAFLTARLLLGGRVPGLTQKRVAVLPIVGIIDSETRFVRELQAFRDDPSVRAFVLEIRSPGGGVGASQSIHAELQRLRMEDDRPLIAWIGAIGASGGYYVALPADSIFALPGSITGSIGVIMQFPNAEELFRKVGLELEVVKSGSLKDMGSPARELSEEERQVLQGLVDDVWNQFVDAVVDGRDMSRTQVVRLADGRVLSGEAAMEQASWTDSALCRTRWMQREGCRVSVSARESFVLPEKRSVCSTCLAVWTRRELRAGFRRPEQEQARLPG